MITPVRRGNPVQRVQAYVAAAIQEPVLEVVTEDQPVRADGGMTLEKFVTDDDDRLEYDCDELSDDFPC